MSELISEGQFFYFIDNVIINRYNINKTKMEGGYLISFQGFNQKL